VPKHLLNTDPVLGILQHLTVGCAVNISMEYTASIFIFFQNVANSPQSHITKTQEQNQH